MGVSQLLTRNRKYEGRWSVVNTLNDLDYCEFKDAQIEEYTTEIVFPIHSGCEVYVLNCWKCSIIGEEI